MSAIAHDSRFPVAAHEPAAKALGGRPRSAGSEAPVWCAEVSTIPARVLFALPISPSLAVHVLGIEGAVRFNVDGEEAEPGDVSFDLDEWHALVLATEADRVWPQDFRAICQRKLDEPAYRLELFDALAGAQPDPSERWDVGAILDRLGANLLSVDAVS